jgi:adenylylsulfate kinase-like enzyme
MKRATKGLYAKARIANPNFTGIDDSYEAPISSFVVDTRYLSVETISNSILTVLMDGLNRLEPA